MNVFPIGLVFLGIFFVARLRGLGSGLAVATAFLPFGALSVLSVGNFNFLLYHMTFMLLVVWGMAGYLISNRQINVPIPEYSVLVFLILTVYAVFSAFLMPRIFEGNVLVFSIDAGVSGHRISAWFPSYVSRLRPSSGNISQSAYFVLSFTIFIFCLYSLRRRGSTFVLSAIYLTAFVNILLGMLDLIGLEELLLQFKTAGYAIFQDVRVEGIQRNIGGFTESSSMGSFSAVLTAFLFSVYLDTGRFAPLLLGIGNLILCILALSSTGFFALGVVGIFLLFRAMRQNLSSKVLISRGARTAAWIILGGTFTILMFLVTDIGAIIFPFIDFLVFSKSQSLSGMERAAWALRGLELGVETYGFGAGLGSTRSNGLISVWFGNLGVPGMTMLFLFLYSVFRKPKSSYSSDSDQYMHNAAKAGLVAYLAARMVSGTTADPGVLFVILAATAIASKPPILIRRKRALV